MEQQATRTVSLKLEPHPALAQTLAAYAAACNLASGIAHADGGTSSYVALQQRCYHEVRAASGLSAQLTCSVLRQVAAAYASMKANKQALRLARFEPSAALLQGGERGRDFRLLPDQRVSLSTVAGRLKLSYTCGTHQRQYLNGEWAVGAATLIHRKAGYFLNITLSRPVEVQALREAASIIGVDLGQSNLAVAAGPDGKAKFFGGGHVRNRKRHYRRVRAQLQAKGTRGAKRVLRRLSGRERHFQRDVNHCVAKAVVAFAARYPKPTLAIEDLRGIRARAKRSSNAQRSDFHSWAFAQLQTFLRYKAEAAGMTVTVVRPNNTSKACSRCGHLAPGQRRRHAFRCDACGFQLHSDLNGARNIAHRLRHFREGLEAAGLPVSTSPEVTASAPSGCLASGKLPASAGSR